MQGDTSDIVRKADLCVLTLNTKVNPDDWPAIAATILQSYNELDLNGIFSERLLENISFCFVNVNAKKNVRTPLFCDVFLSRL